MAGDPILHNGECVGYVSSGGTGFRIGQCLALGYVNNNIDELATAFELQILGQLCQAKLESSAFYDPDNSRL